MLSGKCPATSQQQCSELWSEIPRLCTIPCLNAQSDDPKAQRACSKCTLHFISGNGNNSIENTLLPCCGCLPSLGKAWGFGTGRFHDMILSTCIEHPVLDDDDMHSDDDLGPPPPPPVTQL